jgi:SAM-dependent methyltransferase
MWDERYSVSEYIYGTQPNDFLNDNFAKLKKGTLLSLADGEGRNGVFLAIQGFTVTALDASSVGLEKARRLAMEKEVTLSTIQQDLAVYEFAESSWDNIISIFCHLPTAVRQNIHQGIIKGLKPGGIFLLEAYTPEQLNYGTGGPADADLMPTLSELKNNFAGMKILHGLETVRPVIEGKYHSGKAAVVQFIAQKV